MKAKCNNIANLSGNTRYNWVANIMRNSGKGVTRVSTQTNLTQYGIGILVRQGKRRKEKGQSEKETSQASQAIHVCRWYHHKIL